MKTPRDWSGSDLITRLARIGYEVTRQTGSHVRLSRKDPAGDHHITVPLHAPLRVGTLNAILSDIATHLGIEKQALLSRLT